MLIHNLQKQQFMILVEDDIHFIHAKHHPTSSVTSTTWHMCTGIVDIHETIQAVPLGGDMTKNHRNVQVTMKDGSVRQCRGGIDIQHLLGYVTVKMSPYYTGSFLDQLPGAFKDFKLENAQKSFKELRYCSPTTFNSSKD